jgi:hypothetical protein
LALCDPGRGQNDPEADLAGKLSPNSLTGVPAEKEKQQKLQTDTLQKYHILALKTTTRLDSNECKGSLANPYPVRRPPPPHRRRRHHHHHHRTGSAHWNLQSSKIISSFAHLPSNSFRSSCPLSHCFLLF